MSTIIPTNGNINTAEEQAKAASRPVPQLQPMRIVQVSESQPAENVDLKDPSNQVLKSGKKVVMSKKELEKLEAEKAKKPAANKPIIPNHLRAETVLMSTEERNLQNAQRIEGNYSRKSEPVYPEEWAGLPRVYRAWLQTPISVSGIFSSESTLTSDKFEGLVMTVKDGFLVIRYKDSEHGTPLANVKHLIFKERPAGA